MDYENFKERFVEDLKDKLYEKGIEADVSVNTVNKLNDSYEAVTIKPVDDQVGVNISLNKCYEAYEDGTDYNIIDTAGIRRKRSVEDESLEIGNEKIYDLSGRQVKTPGKGVYIINGKKVVRK